jgi:hypothetical protein
VSNGNDNDSWALYEVSNGLLQPIELQPGSHMHSDACILSNTVDHAVLVIVW